MFCLALTLNARITLVEQHCVINITLDIGLISMKWFIISFLYYTFQWSKGLAMAMAVRHKKMELLEDIGMEKSTWTVNRYRKTHIVIISYDIFFTDNFSLFPYRCLIFFSLSSLVLSRIETDLSVEHILSVFANSFISAEVNMFLVSVAPWRPWGKKQKLKMAIMAIISLSNREIEQCAFMYMTRSSRAEKMTSKYALYAYHQSHIEDAEWYCQWSRKSSCY